MNIAALLKYVLIYEEIRGVSIFMPKWCKAEWYLVLYCLLRKQGCDWWKKMLWRHSWRYVKHELGKLKNNMKILNKYLLILFLKNWLKYALSTNFKKGWKSMPCSTICAPRNIMIIMKTIKLGIKLSLANGCSATAAAQWLPLH